MAERTTIARPYADAAFQIARDENALARWSEMMKLARGMGDDQRMANALTSPRLEASEKTSFFLDVAGDRFSDPMRNFVRILIEADRIGLLPEIAALFESMRNDAEGVARATIESAGCRDHGGAREAVRQAHRGIDDDQSRADRRGAHCGG
jgi:F-type H+-transporting ATPase subunit delta